MSSRWPHILSLALLAGWCGAAMAAGEARSEALIAADEKALEDNLIAPCCWRQTLAVHDSPLSDSLRSEIKRRLTAGETTDAIRADLVRRYGDRIKAHPDGFPIGWFLLGVAVLGGVAGGVPLAMAVRSRRGRQEPGAASAPLAGPPGPPGSPETDDTRAAASPPDERRKRLEQRLQAELDALDE